MNKKAFTLIELLVVISIIALLISILMPALGKAREQARMVLDLSNLRQLGVLTHLYAADNDDKFVEWRHGEGGGTFWVKRFEPYFDGLDEIVLCPFAKKPYEEGAKIPMGARTAYYDETLPLPEREEKDNVVYVSYGPNGWLCSSIPQLAQLNTGWPLPMDQHWKTVSATPAYNIPVFLDCGHYDGWPKHTDEPPQERNEGMTGDESRKNMMKRFCIDRHNKLINTVFLDGAATDVGLKDLWTLKWNKAFDTNVPKEWPEWME